MARKSFTAFGMSASESGSAESTGRHRLYCSAGAVLSAGADDEYEPDADEYIGIQLSWERGYCFSTDSTGNTSETRGVVDYVEMKGGDAYLSIDGKMFSIDDLVQVMDSFYAIKEYLPSVEEQNVKFDKSTPSLLQVKINLGSNGYEASSVAVSINGDYVSKDYLQYDADEGILTILPGAFEELTPGSYKMGFYFDDPYNTSVTDKVIVQVVNGTSSGGTGTQS